MSIAWTLTVVAASGLAFPPPTESEVKKLLELTAQHKAKQEEEWKAPKDKPAKDVKGPTAADLQKQLLGELAKVDLSEAPLATIEKLLPTAYAVNSPSYAKKIQDRSAVLGKVPGPKGAAALAAAAYVVPLPASVAEIKRYRKESRALYIEALRHPGYKQAMAKETYSPTSCGT